MNTDRERLLRLAALEDGCPIGVGGMPKVLFLDVDGVLNSRSVLTRWNEQGRRASEAIDNEMVARINRVVDATGCFIVISSTWRLCWPMGELTAKLRQHGLRDVVIGKTPTLKRRDEEILAWLAENKGVAHFAAVDDDTFDMTGLGDRLVATSFETGIQDNHVEQLIKLLNDSSS